MEESGVYLVEYKGYLRVQANSCEEAEELARNELLDEAEITYVEEE